MTVTTRARRRRGLVAAGVIALAVIAAFAALLPPRAVRAPPIPKQERELIGALHVHTTRSDGTGSVDEVAAAASAAGLDFVVLGDHGDGTRPPEPPRYASGVLCIDGVEIGTTAGHYVAIGLERASPYPLGGEPRDVVEDVHRLGGFGIVSHPASPNRDLRWRDWSAPIAGIEWLNADSEWRDEAPRSIARALATYFVRPPEVIASLFNQPAVLERWDALAMRRRVVAVAGHDAHARIGLHSDEEPADEGFSIHVPSYEAVFRTFAQRVRLEESPTGDPDRDARLVLRALRAGHTYTVIDAFASPGRLVFEAAADGVRVQAGDEIDARGPVTLTARASPAPGTSVLLRRNGRVVESTAGSSIEHVHRPGSGTAVYRVEVRIEGTRDAAAVPWMVSNPIWVDRPRDDARRIEPPPAAADRTVFGGIVRGHWAAEKDRSSSSRIDVTAGLEGRQALRFVYALGPGVPQGQYAAAVLALDPRAFPQWDRVRFRAAASSEMRVSVQVREPARGRRWRRSVVLGEEPREVVVRLDDMSFAEPVLGGRPPREELASLLFVVDTMHARPGSRGTIWIEHVQLEREEGSRQVRTVSSM